jgi:predicted lipoprotein with Yx(FWY)xxD motif
MNHPGHPVRLWLRLLAGAALVLTGLTVTVGGVASAAPRAASQHHAAGPPSAPGTSCATRTTAVPTGPAVVSAASTQYGRVLVVGSGPNAGCSLYYLTSDQPQRDTYACTNAGSSGVQCDTDIWPALLTDGSPEAGPGVNPTLLGAVARTDVLSGHTVEQVTYAGHPLYQFSADTAPGQTKGNDLFDSFTGPPGVWYLISPARGLAAPGTAMLAPLSATVTTASGSTTETVLSVTRVGDDSSPPALAPRLFPTYTFSADSGHQSSCTDANVFKGNVCSVIWPPVLTTGRPQATGGLDPHSLGIIVRPDGSHQVTWDGHPLYLFIKDALPETRSGTALGEGLGSQFGGMGFFLTSLNS